MHCISRSGCYLVNSLCDVQEENHWKKESYQACWINVVLETRPQYRQTLSEKNITKRESYKQQQVVHFIVERNPSQTLSLGSSNGNMTEHQLPLLKKNKASSEAKTPSESPKQERLIESLLNQGLNSGDLTKPVQTDYRAVNLMSSSQEMSHMGQRRE